MWPLSPCLAEGVVPAPTMGGVSVHSPPPRSFSSLLKCSLLFFSVRVGGWGGDLKATTITTLNILAELQVNPIQLNCNFYFINERFLICLCLNSISHFDWFHISSFLLSPLLHLILILNIWENQRKKTNGKLASLWLFSLVTWLVYRLSATRLSSSKCVLDNIIDYSRHPPTAAAAFFYIFFFFLLPPASTQVPPPSLPSRERGRRGWGRGETERGYLTLISGCRPAWILHQHRPEQVELEHFP